VYVHPHGIVYYEFVDTNQLLHFWRDYQNQANIIDRHANNNMKKTTNRKQCLLEVENEDDDLYKNRHTLIQSLSVTLNNDINNGDEQFIETNDLIVDVESQIDMINEHISILELQVEMLQAVVTEARDAVDIQRRKLQRRTPVVPHE
jgi:SepF-like predicted cell division protein (DUF552 family)